MVQQQIPQNLHYQTQQNQYYPQTPPKKQDLQSHQYWNQFPLNRSPCQQPEKYTNVSPNKSDQKPSFPNQDQVNQVKQQEQKFYIDQQLKEYEKKLYQIEGEFKQIIQNEFNQQTSVITALQEKIYLFEMQNSVQHANKNDKRLQSLEEQLYASKRDSKENLQVQELIQNRLQQQYLSLKKDFEHHQIIQDQKLKNHPVNEIQQIALQVSQMKQIITKIENDQKKQEKVMVDFISNKFDNNLNQLKIDQQKLKVQCEGCDKFIQNINKDLQALQFQIRNFSKSDLDLGQYITQLETFKKQQMEQINNLKQSYNNVQTQQQEKEFTLKNEINFSIERQFSQIKDKLATTINQFQEEIDKVKINVKFNEKQILQPNYIDPKNYADQINLFKDQNQKIFDENQRIKDQLQQQKEEYEKVGRLLKNQNEEMIVDLLSQKQTVDYELQKIREDMNQLINEKQKIQLKQQQSPNPTDKQKKEKQSENQGQEISAQIHQPLNNELFVNQHPNKNRLRIVQDLINEIYNLSWRKRSAQGEFLLFIRGEQNFTELCRNYGIRSSEMKAQLAKICNSFRQARGDGNCFYTAFGFQYFYILLNKLTLAEYQKFIQQMDEIIQFKINYGQGQSIQSKEIQSLCWEELKYRLQYLRNLNDQEEFIKHYQSYEQSIENELIDGCFYGLSTIFFRNLANYLVDNSEMKQAVYDQYNLLIWEEECNSNEVVIDELAKYLQVHVKLVFFEQGAINLREYSQGMRHQIILLIRPGHYNIGYKNEQIN